MGKWGYLSNEVPVRYHTHVNVHMGGRRDSLPEGDRKALAELKARLATVGLAEDSFLPEGSGYESFMHLTGKFTDKTAFDQARELVSHILASHGDLYAACYQEDEALPVDMATGFRPFVPSVPFPFRLSYGRDEPGVYKQAELHASARDRGLVDPRTHRVLQEAGFHIAYLPKPEGTVAAIYTVNGTLEQIRRIALPTYEWLRDAGGFGRGSLKVEVMVGGIKVYGEPIIEFMPQIHEVLV